MPQLTVTGISLPQLQEICPALHRVTVKASIARPEDVKLEWKPSVQLNAVGICTGHPKIEILWLGRPQDVQDQTAAAITKVFQDCGYSLVQVTFRNLPGSDFYENGNHY